MNHQTAQSKKPFATIQHLRAGYGKNTILDDIHIEDIRQGELVGLIGPNASGKSTLFRSLAGLMNCQGTVIVNNQDLHHTKKSVWSNIVGIMPQQYDVHIALTVFDSILLALKSHGQWRVNQSDLQRVESILNTLHLSHLAERQMYELSGGQKQMVAMARLLVRQPPFILLDEPTSALDLRHQLSAMQAIKNITKDNHTATIVALHDLNLASAFCDRLLLLRNGQVVLDGTPQTVLANPIVEETYRVKLGLEKTQRGTHFVDAYLNKQPDSTL